MYLYYSTVWKSQPLWLERKCLVVQLPSHPIEPVPDKLYMPESPIIILDHVFVVLVYLLASLYCIIVCEI